MFALGPVLPRSTRTSSSEALSAQASYQPSRSSDSRLPNPLRSKLDFTESPPKILHLLHYLLDSRVQLPCHKQPTHMDSPLWPDVSLCDPTQLPCSIPPSMLVSSPETSSLP